MKNNNFRKYILLILLSGLIINFHKGHVLLTTTALNAYNPLNEDGGENDNPTYDGDSLRSGSTHTIKYIYDKVGNRISRQYVLLQSKTEEGNLAKIDNREDKQPMIYQYQTKDNLLTEYINGKVAYMNFLYL